jgi:uncharacterized membrane protein
MRYMNEKTLDELKKARKNLHIGILVQLSIFAVLLGAFGFYWFCTTETLMPFALAIFAILYCICIAVYIIKRDIHTVMIYLKEATETDEKPQ